jgi:mono/diheme cytochrome c family protein
MAEKTRQYIFTEEQTRVFFVSLSALMILSILGILLLASSRPRGKFVELDRSPYLNTLNESSDLLSKYHRNEDGSVSIPIERAMELVAERGVVNPFSLVAIEGDSTGSESMVSADTSAADGEAVFKASCSACHQTTGQGIPTVFPNLVGHAPLLYTASRDYLPTLVLNGLQGKIEIAGNAFDGVMPAWKQLSDADLAAALNYVLTAWDNEALLPADFAPYTAEAIAAQRTEELSAAEVYELRQTLDLQGR